MPVSNEIKDLSKTSARDVETIKPGDKVKIQTRKGWKPGVIVSYEFSYRARTKPHIIKMTTDDGGDYSGSFKKGKYSELRFLELVSRGRGGKGTKKKQDESKARELAREEKAAERVADGVAALDHFDIKVGDVIAYRYRSTTAHEIVTGTNYRTGKVGIDRFKGNERGKQQYLDRIEARKETADLMSYYHGLRARRPSDRSSRWLDAAAIVKVISRAADVR